MRRRLTLASALAVLLAAAGAGAIEPYTGVRELGLGGGSRGFATGQGAMLLNPSGISLLRSYSLEGGYQVVPKDSAHGLHASIVDSTSGFHLGGGVSYTFFHASPSGTPAQNAHDVRVALSFPFADKVMIGATGRYLYVADPKTASGITVDAGLTIRPIPELSAGVVGQNLREIDVGLPLAQRQIGYGVAFTGIDDLMVVVDGRTLLPTDAPGDKSKTSLMGGLEIFLARKVALRGGGGWDAVREAGYVSAGLSSVSEAIGLDLSASQDVSGGRKLTTLAAGVRVFVPAPGP